MCVYTHIYIYTHMYIHIHIHIQYQIVPKKYLCSVYSGHYGNMDRILIRGQGRFHYTFLKQAQNSTYHNNIVQIPMHKLR